jgi:hypothetical protein
LLSRLGRVLAILQVVLGTANHGERTGWCSQRRQPSRMMSVSMLSWRCSTVCTFPRPSATPCPAIGLEDGVIVRASRWPSPGGDYDHRPIPSSDGAARFMSRVAPAKHVIIDREPAEFNAG